MRSRTHHQAAPPVAGRKATARRPDDRPLRAARGRGQAGLNHRRVADVHHQQQPAPDVARNTDKSGWYSCSRASANLHHRHPPCGDPHAHTETTSQPAFLTGRHASGYRSYSARRGPFGVSRIEAVTAGVTIRAPRTDSVRRAGALQPDANAVPQQPVEAQGAGPAVLRTGRCPFRVSRLLQPRTHRPGRRAGEDNVAANREHARTAPVLPSAPSFPSFPFCVPGRSARVRGCRHTRYTPSRRPELHLLHAGHNEVR